MNIPAKKLLVLMLCSFIYTNASALSVVSTSKNTYTIHETELLTNGKTLPGSFTFAVGTGDGFACNIQHTIGPEKMTFKDILFLDGNQLATLYGLDLTCAIETYETDNGTTAISYSLNLNRSKTAYTFSSPYKDEFTLA